MPDTNLRIISGRANIPFAERVAKYLGLNLVDVLITDFADNEIFVKIREDIRGKDVFIIQPTNNPGYKNIFELLIMLDALRRASAKSLTVVMPYFGYARQERKAEPRVPITAKLVANLITVAGANRVLTMDLHAAQIQGFFDIPVDHLYATPVFLEKAKTFKNLENCVVVAPDTGGVDRTRFFAKQLDLPIAILDKRRERKNVAEVLNLIGDVEGKHAILVDDIIDTAGTITQAANMLKQKGATEISVFCTHAVFSPPAAERIRDSAIDKIYVTDTILMAEEKKAIIGDKLCILSVCELFGQAIERIYLNLSVSSLFVNSSKVE